MTQIPENDPERRAITMTRTATGQFIATSQATGASIKYGRGEGLLTPVELLLAALSGCTGIDLDLPASRRSEPDVFTAEVEARNTKVDGRNTLKDISITWDLQYPDTEAGRKVTEMLPQLMKQSEDRLCTVSITVSTGTPVTHHLKQDD